MRIRKHAKISPLIYASSSLKPQTLLQCKLNQSPWDVMGFSPPSTPPPPPPPPSSQLDRNDNFERNRSLEDSISPFESVTSMKKAADNEHLTGEINRTVKPDYSDGGSASDNSDELPENPRLKKENRTIYCSKNNGKQWKCKREVASGYSFCHHHLSLVQNLANLVRPAMKKQDNVAAARVAAYSHRRPRAKKAALTSNPYEFYYYSGFGPRWGKKRSENDISRGNKEVSENVVGEMEIEPSTLSRTEDEQSEIEYEEEEEDDDYCEIGRKRGRKRIKARSLKSLM